jgi:hypothetical protein
MTIVDAPTDPDIPPSPELALTAKRMTLPPATGFLTSVEYDEPKIYPWGSVISENSKPYASPVDHATPPRSFTSYAKHSNFLTPPERSASSEV